MWDTDPAREGRGQGLWAARLAVGTRHLSMAQDQLRPALPLGTLVSVGEGGGGFPAAVLVVKPEAC